MEEDSGGQLTPSPLILEDFGASQAHPAYGALKTGTGAC